MCLVFIVSIPIFGECTPEVESYVNLGKQPALRLAPRSGRICFQSNVTQSFLIYILNHGWIANELIPSTNHAKERTKNQKEDIISPQCIYILHKTKLNFVISDDLWENYSRDLKEL